MFNVHELIYSLEFCGFYKKWLVDFFQIFNIFLQDLDKVRLGYRQGGRAPTARQA